MGKTYPEVARPEIGRQHLTTLQAFCVFLHLCSGSIYDRIICLESLALFKSGETTVFTGSRQSSHLFESHASHRRLRTSPIWLLQLPW